MVVRSETRLLLSCSKPSNAHRTTLMRHQRRDRLCLLDRGWIPLASKRVGLRRIEPHRQIEPRLGRRKPVSLLTLPRTIALKMEVERTVRGVLERHPATHGKAIE